MSNNIRFLKILCDSVKFIFPILIQIINCLASVSALTNLYDNVQTNEHMNAINSGKDHRTKHHTTIITPLGTRIWRIFTLKIYICVAA